MVMLLLLTGLLLLNGVQRQLDAAIRQGAGEREYLRAYNQAASALSWGETQRWRVTAGLFCQEADEEALRVCLSPADGRDVRLLWGEGVMRPQKSRLRLYQRVRLVPDPNQREEHRLQSLPQGWLDYCPAGYQQWCDPLP